MTKEFYCRMTDSLRKRPILAKTVDIANKILTYVIFVSYPALVLYLFLTKSTLTLRAVIVPALSFVILSVLRRIINEKRPYERFGSPPVIPKSTKGKSFPSRHVFCVAIIGMTYLFCFPVKAVGVTILVIAAAMAVIRVISGVHYVRDVTAGMLFGILSGILGFML
jgi:membrane-associated phospholipid phosphatase